MKEIKITSRTCVVILVLHGLAAYAINDGPILEIIYKKTDKLFVQLVTNLEQRGSFGCDEPELLLKLRKQAELEHMIKKNPKSNLNYNLHTHSRLINLVLTWFPEGRFLELEKQIQKNIKNKTTQEDFIMRRLSSKKNIRKLQINAHCTRSKNRPQKIAEKQ